MENLTYMFAVVLLQIRSLFDEIVYFKTFQVTVTYPFRAWTLRRRAWSIRYPRLKLLFENLFESCFNFFIP